MERSLKDGSLIFETGRESCFTMAVSLCNSTFWTIIVISQVSHDPRWKLLFFE